MRVVIFDPFGDKPHADYLAKIHQAEMALLDDCVPDRVIVDESEEGEPIFETADPAMVDNTAILLKHSVNFPGLLRANEEAPLSFLLPLDTFNYFVDASMIDGYFLPALDQVVNKHYDVKAVLLMREREYFGHVWFFSTAEMPNICGIYGMKSALVNIIARASRPDNQQYRKGIATKLLQEGVFKLAAGKRLVVPWPLPPMVPILENMGFQQVKTDEMTAERSFLSKITSTREYYFLDL